MKNMSKWVLGAAVLAGALSLGATSAQAAEFGIYVGGPVAYVPPCPRAGYVWTAGYMNRGYWVPGRWEFRGYRDRDHVAYLHRDRDDWRFRSDRDDHHFDRDRDWDRDHFRR
jgi:hypothetical protein